MKEFRNNKRIRRLRSISRYPYIPVREDFIRMKTHRNDFNGSIYLIDKQNEKNNPDYGKNPVLTAIVNMNISLCRWTIEFGEGDISHALSNKIYNLKNISSKHRSSNLRSNIKRDYWSIRVYRKYKRR